MDVNVESPSLALEEISSGFIIHGPHFTTTAAWALEAAKEHDLKLFVLDRFGELTGIASRFEDLVIVKPVKRRFNPLKPFGPPGPSVLSALYAVAFAVGRESPNNVMVSRAQELVMAGKEPTGVSLAADLLEQEIDELEMLVRPSSVQYLGNKEDFDMEAVLSHDVLVDLSLVSAADEATVICLSCLIRAIALLKPGTSFVLITHPDIFFQARMRMSPASVQFLHDLLSSILSRGINIAVACQSPELVPLPVRLKMLARIREHGRHSRVEVSSPNGRRVIPIKFSVRGSPPSDDEIDRRILPFVNKVREMALPPWLVSDFGDEAEAAAEVIKYVAEKQPRLDEAIGWANDLAKGVGGSIVGRLVRLRYGMIEQVGSGTVVVLAEKGKRILSFIAGES